MSLNTSCRSTICPKISEQTNVTWVQLAEPKHLCEKSIPFFHQLCKSTYLKKEIWISAVILYYFCHDSRIISVFCKDQNLKCSVSTYLDFLSSGNAQKCEERKEIGRLQLSDTQATLIDLLRKKVPSDHYLSYKEMEWTLPIFSYEVIYWISIQAGLLARHHKESCLAFE